MRRNNNLKSWKILFPGCGQITSQNNFNLSLQTVFMLMFIFKNQLKTLKFNFLEKETQYNFQISKFTSSGEKSTRGNYLFRLSWNIRRFEVIFRRRFRAKNRCHFDHYLRLRFDVYFRYKIRVISTTILRLVFDVELGHEIAVISTFIYRLLFDVELSHRIAVISTSISRRCRYVPAGLAWWWWCAPSFLAGSQVHFCCWIWANIQHWIKALA